MHIKLSNNISVRRVFPDDWNLIRIEEVTKFHKQGYYTQEHYKPNGKYYLLRGTDMKSPEIDLSTTPKIESNEIDYLSYQVAEGDFLFVRSGAIGRYGIVPKELPKSIFGSYIINFRFTNEILSTFLGYLYQSELCLEQLKSITQGGGNLNINAENIKKLIIPLPPLPEQQAIAEVLTDTDNLIQALEKQIAKKRMIKQGVMQELLRPKEVWEMRSMDSLFNIFGGFSASRDQLSDKGYCYLHYGDIHGSTKPFLDCSADFMIIPKLNIILSKISTNSILRNGDIAFVDASEDEEGTSRHVVIENKVNIPFIARLHTITARSKDESIDLLFKRYCFQSKLIKDQFRFFSVGTKVSGVSKTSIRNIIVPIPSLKEQKEIAEALVCIDSEIDLLNVKLSKCKSLKKGLMQQLLTGKTRLNIS